MDDKRGILGVDRAGQLLDTVIGMKMPKGYGWAVTSAIRCFTGEKPSGGAKDPKVGELAACKLYLQQEILQLKPKVIVMMGKGAMHNVLDMPIKDCKCSKAAGMTFNTEWGITALAMNTPRWVAVNPDINLPIWEPEWDRLVELLENDGQVSNELPGAWEWITEKEEVEAWYREMIERARSTDNFRLAYDYETNGLNPRKDNFRCVGYATDAEHAYILPMAEKWQQDWHRLLIAECDTLYVHNMLFEMEWYYSRFGTLPKGLVVDTKCLAFLHNENLAMDLGSLTAGFVPQYAGFKGESEMFGVDITEVPEHVIAYRCAYDCMATWALAHELEGRLSDDQLSLYESTIEPGLKTVAKTKEHGLVVDQSVLQDEIHARLERLSACDDAIQADPDIIAFRESERKRLRLVRKPTFNVKSSPQKQKFLTQVVGLKPADPSDLSDTDKKAVKWKKKKLSECMIATKGEVLEKYLDRHPVIEHFIEYVGINHDISHFLNATLKYMDPKTGKLHPGYNWGGQTRPGEAKGTVTARLSAAKPNVMNPPKWFRKCFISRWGLDGRIVAADYSQLEMRIAAVGCPEPVWMKAFIENIDLHQSGADGMGVERDVAKTINYGKMYGAGPGKLAGQAKQSVKWANEMFAKWDETHAGFAQFNGDKRQEALDNGQVTGFFAQILHVPDALSDDSGEVNHALNRAGNFPYQNAAGYITMDAMHLLDARLERAGLQAIVIGQMHDAIYVDCPRHEVQAVKRIMRETMVDMQHQRWGWLQGILEIDFEVGRTMAGNPLKGE
jgi:uracil-DNA glycosylase family 4